MSPGRRYDEGTLGHLLVIDLREVEHGPLVGNGHLESPLRGRNEGVTSPHEIGDHVQTHRSGRTTALASPPGHEREALGSGEGLVGHLAAHPIDVPVEPQLAHEEAVVEELARYLVGRGQDCRGDGQVEAGTRLLHGPRHEVDVYAQAWKLEPTGLECVANAIA